MQTITIDDGKTVRTFRGNILELKMRPDIVSTPNMATGQRENAHSGRGDLSIELRYVSDEIAIKGVAARGDQP